MPLGGVYLPAETGLHHPGVVEQQIDAAEALQREVAQGFHLLRVADVGHQAGDLHTLPSQRLCQGRKALLADIAQHQAQAARAGFFRQAAANAAGRACDHSHLATFDSHG
ncbi:hypothetical protein D9M71_464490 [compost metagenome]